VRFVVSVDSEVFWPLWRRRRRRPGHAL